MRKFHQSFYAGVLSFLLCTATFNANAQQAQDSRTRTSTSQGTAQTLLGSDALRDDLASEWGLTQQEYQRYSLLMQGSRGIYSPGLDPLTALGIEARTDEERRRFAELQVRAERRRVDKELAYQRAYDEANARLYPGEKAFIIRSGSDASSSAAGIISNGRLAVFVREQCESCVTQVQQLQLQQKPFDIYFIGSQGDDERIRRWAILAGVDPKNVRSQQITLNHDQGRWMRLGLGGELPAQVLQVNGQWQRQ